MAKADEDIHATVKFLEVLCARPEEVTNSLNKALEKRGAGFELRCCWQNVQKKYEEARTPLSEAVCQSPHILRQDYENS